MRTVPGALGMAAKGQNSFMSKKTFNFRIRYSLVPGSASDRAKEIGRAVADILNAWPWPIAPSRDRVRRSFVRLAVERVIGRQKPQIRDCTVHG